MNFVEAVNLARQGKCMRRAEWAYSVWLETERLDGMDMVITHPQSLGISADDVVAQDWEVHERSTK